jgi:hypothetical protein
LSGKQLPPTLILRYKSEATEKPLKSLTDNVGHQQAWMWGSSEFEEEYCQKVFQMNPRHVTELEDKQPVSLSFGQGQIFATTSIVLSFLWISEQSR